jgi:hypothetical protein
MAIEIDRIVLDDVGANPERLARAIHDQLGTIAGPVPVHDIARALDILEIRAEPLTGFEAALIAPPERGHGAILVNSRSSRQRQRYSVGHELGHYLSPLHEPVGDRGFRCTRSDMLVSGGESRHLRQEAQANQFAIELLAPAERLRAALDAPADLTAVLAIATELDISKTAAARRYVALHDETLALVLSKDGRVLYAERPREFPALAIWKGDPLPEMPVDAGGASMSEWMDVDAPDWLKTDRHAHLSAQMLIQANGYAMTLLRLEMDEADAEEEGDLDGLPAFRP